MSARLPHHVIARRGAMHPSRYVNLNDTPGGGKLTARDFAHLAARPAAHRAHGHRTRRPHFLRAGADAHQIVGLVCLAGLAALVAALVAGWFR